MDVYEAIEKRRTIRIFKKGASEEQLRRIVLAGAKAPSAGNRQPWEFVIIDDPNIIDQLAEIKYQLNRTFTPGPDQTQKDVEDRALNQKRWFKNASVVAVCTRSEQSANGWLAVENMSLAAVAEGLGSNIISYWDEAKKAVETLICLPGDYELTCVLKFGVSGEEGRPMKRRPEFSWLHKNKFRYFSLTKVEGQDRVRAHVFGYMVNTARWILGLRMLWLHQPVGQTLTGFK
jgi:nitroreductase